MYSLFCPNQVCTIVNNSVHSDPEACLFLFPGSYSMIFFDGPFQRNLYTMSEYSPVGPKIWIEIRNIEKVTFYWFPLFFFNRDSIPEQHSMVTIAFTEAQQIVGKWWHRLLSPATVAAPVIPIQPRNFHANFVESMYTFLIFSGKSIQRRKL